MRAAMIVAVIAAGCVDISNEHRCAVDNDCAEHCEQPTGNCSVADISCGPTGRRYDDKSGDRSGVCVYGASTPTALGPISFSDQDDTVDSACAPDARDLLIELDSPGPQILFAMTDPSMTNTPVAMMIRDGACPGASPISECATGQCPTATTITMLATQIPMGRSCLVIEAVGGAAAGQVGVQLLPALRTGVAISPAMPNLPGQNTCPGQAEPNMVCGNPTSIPAAAYLFALCPGNYRLDVTVSPSAPLDPVIALRPQVPYFDDSAAPACEDANTGTTPEMIVNQTIPGPGAYWLLVEAAGGGTCGPFDLTGFSITPQ